MLDSAAAPRLVSSLAWPIIGEQLLQTLVGVVDIAMVGRLGAAAVAGVGTATQLLQVAISAMGAISVGTTVLVAHETGARRPGAAAHATKQSLVTGLALGAVLAIVGSVLRRPFVQMLGPEQAVVESGATYMGIVALSSPLLVTMLVAGASFRGAGDSRTPLMASGIMNVVNVALAFVLVFGKLGFPALGVAGSALAAALARVVGASILLVLLVTHGAMSLPGGWTPDWGVIRRVLRIGIPTAVEQTMLSGGFLLYAAMVITMGTVVYATQRITFQAINLALMPAFGFGTAATTLTGQGLGAQRPDFAEAATRTAFRQAMFWIIAAGAFSAVFANPIMRLFTTDPEVIRLGTVAIPVLTLAQPFWAIGQVYAGTLRGAGDSRFPMLATSLSMWFVRLPTAYLFGIILGGGLPGVYLSSTFDAGLRAALNYVRYRRGAWRELEI